MRSDVQACGVVGDGIFWDEDAAGKFPWLYGDVTAVDKGKEAGEDRIRAEHVIDRTRVQVFI